MAFGARGRKNSLQTSEGKVFCAAYRRAARRRFVLRLRLGDSKNQSRHQRLVSRDGGNGYFYALFRRYVDDNAVVIVATNSPLPSLQKDFGRVVQSIFSTDSGK